MAILGRPEGLLARLGGVLGASWGILAAKTQQKRGGSEFLWPLGTVLASFVGCFLMFSVCVSYASGCCWYSFGTRSGCVWGAGVFGAYSGRIRVYSGCIRTTHVNFEIQICFVQVSSGIQNFKKYGQKNFIV